MSRHSLWNGTIIDPATGQTTTVPNGLELSTKIREICEPFPPAQVAFVMMVLLAEEIVRYGLGGGSKSQTLVTFEAVLEYVSSVYEEESREEKN